MRAPIIYNKTMTLANTEYSQKIPPQTTEMSIQCRGFYDVKIAFAPNMSGTTYWTIKAGGMYYEQKLDLAGRTLYFQCPEAGQVLEMIFWQK